MAIRIYNGANALEIINVSKFNTMQNKHKSISFLPFTIIKRWTNSVKVSNAKRQANQMHKLTNKQYYVIQIYGKMRVYDRNRINLLIDRKVLSTRLRSNIELKKVCVYYTT